MSPAFEFLMTCSGRITCRNKELALHMTVQLGHSSLPELEHSKVLVLGSMVRLGGGNTS